MSVLVQYPAGRSRAQLAILTKYALHGGGFLNALGSLRTKELIEGRDPYQITESGRQAIGVWEVLPTGSALREHWITKLSKAERLIIQALAAGYPQPLSKAEVARVTGYEMSGGGFGNALGRLRTLELIAGTHELRINALLMD